ncbi:MAG: hypothetical protein K2X81_06545 [Candidatus Obscuribacterales bacterium]|nr:hypothetical protein [Candidatus Obscuribacterales bacterium]
MARIAVDMDEVMADALGEHIHRYNKAFGTQIERAHLHGKHLKEVIPAEHHRASHEIVHCEDFFAKLKVMDGAQEALEAMSKEHEIYIVTAAMEVPASLAPKYVWLQEHFPFISSMNYVFCGNKHVVQADYLIDDNARHFKLFGGEGILFDAPHNKKVTGYKRVHNWHEAKALFCTSESEQKQACLT